MASTQTVGLPHEGDTATYVPGSGYCTPVPSPAPCFTTGTTADSLFRPPPVVVDAIVVGGGVSGIVSAALLAEQYRHLIEVLRVEVPDRTSSGPSDEEHKSKVLLLEGGSDCGGCVKDVAFVPRHNLSTNGNQDDRKKKGSDDNNEDGDLQEGQYGNQAFVSASVSTVKICQRVVSTRPEHLGEEFRAAKGKKERAENEPEEEGSFIQGRVVVPTGAVEINPTQDRVLGLCEKFGVELDCVRYTDCAIVNGKRCFVDDDQILGFPQTREEGEKFRFVGDFESTSEERYKEFCSQEVFDAFNYYPKKGISHLLRETLRYGLGTANLEVRTHCPVVDVSYDPSTKEYVVTAQQFRSELEIENPTEPLPSGFPYDETHFPSRGPQRKPLLIEYRCKVLVLAIPPSALAQIAGPVSAALLKQRFVFDSRGVPVTTITMWFKDCWWKDSSFHRIWCKYNPLLHVELFGGSEQRDVAHAIRASFADGSASERWRAEAFKPNGTPSSEAVAEMIAALSAMFSAPAATSEGTDNKKNELIALPDPDCVHVAYFPTAWHFEHLEAKVDLWTKQQLAMDLRQLLLPSAAATTAPVQPICEDVIGCRLHLVGEAYNPQRVWMQGAIESAMLSLFPRYRLQESPIASFLGSSLPVLAPPSPEKAQALPASPAISVSSPTDRVDVFDADREEDAEDWGTSTIGGLFDVEGTDDYRSPLSVQPELNGGNNLDDRFPSTEAEKEQAEPETWESEFVIVGGGIAGLASAALLLESDPTRKVLILEAYSDVGGCIRDVTWSADDGLQPVRCMDGFSGRDDAIAKKGVVPAGCIRIPPAHDNLVRLATRLGLEWNVARYNNCAVVNKKRQHLFDPESQSKAEVNLTQAHHKDDDKSKPPNSEIKGKATDDVGFAFDYPETYDEQQLNRFIGDFESVDRQRYDEFAKQEVAGDENFYPTLGLSELPRKLVDVVQSYQGGKIIVNATVKHIGVSYSMSSNGGSSPASSTPSAPFNSNRQDLPYTVTVELRRVGERKSSETIRVRAEHVILAVPPRAVERIQGPLTEFLRAQPFLRESKAIKATTVAMWFPERWWADLPFHRIWNRYSSLIHLELFNDPTKCSTNAIRVSFADGSAFDTFGSRQRRLRLLAKEGTSSTAEGGETFDLGTQQERDTASPPQQHHISSSVIRRVHEALRDLFPDCTVSKPLHTHMELFGSAWHFEHSGATVDIFEKQRLAANLMESFTGHLSVLGPSAYLVGEAYNPQRAWINGALDSVQLSLAPKFVLPLFPQPRLPQNPTTSSATRLANVFEETHLAPKVPFFSALSQPAPDRALLQVTQDSRSPTPLFGLDLPPIKRIVTA